MTTKTEQSSRDPKRITAEREHRVREQEIQFIIKYIYILRIKV